MSKTSVDRLLLSNNIWKHLRTKFFHHLICGLKCQQLTQKALYISHINGLKIIKTFFPRKSIESNPKLNCYLVFWEAVVIKLATGQWKLLRLRFEISFKYPRDWFNIGIGTVSICKSRENTTVNSSLNIHWII